MNAAFALVLAAAALSSATAVQLTPARPLGALAGTSVATAVGIALAGTSDHDAAQLYQLNAYGYALLPFALSFLATQQANAVMQLPSSHSTDQRRAPPPTDPIDEADGAQTCYPINWEECEECELSEEWTEYYGEEIWLCARN
uniref:Uncharacterized protein n=1 Tax=Prymnesium polylepis TaxID=72548 RepID=A0A7S4MA77_9EUKA|mmetsp:Transcript_22451/g.55369  ORF Transcript_22451/g.55369 Transcript_22451/m.55369 type:complete len:143 (+) Transcript_22451:45-473(+)